MTRRQVEHTSGQTERPIKVRPTIARRPKSLGTTTHSSSPLAPVSRPETTTFLAKTLDGDRKIRVIAYNALSYRETSLDDVADISIWRNTATAPPKEMRAGEQPTSFTATTIETRSDTLVDSQIGKVGQPGNVALVSEEVVWINIDGVDDASLLDRLGKTYGLHPLALEDVVNVRQHAKLECYGDNLFFVARMPNVGTKFSTEQVSLFLVGNVVITIQERLGDCLDPVRHRISKSLGRIRQRGADYLAYAIIDAIIDGYFPVLEPYAEELDTVSTKVSVTNDNLPLRLHEIRADLLLIRKVLLQHRDALNNLMREASELVTEDTALYFRDCQDHINRLIEAADTDRETCGELRELYFATLGEKNNAVMKVLTIIATIFIPMSFVAGLYGMNFDSSVSSLNMPELRWAFGYPFALLLMGMLASGLVYYLYRKGWLS